MKFDWRPTATLETLRARAIVLSKVRSFLTERGILEVETPLLSHATITDLHLHSFATQYQSDSFIPTDTLYLQTSPEFAMKRLLAAGSGAIFQLCKAFRNGGERGKMHNPEFTLLEWYRPGFNHHDLMQEIDELLQLILSTSTADKYSYAEIFTQYLDINPHTCTTHDLVLKAQAFSLDNVPNLTTDNKDDWLFLLMSHVIEPQLGKVKPVFIYDFPASQAALAKIRPGTPSVAERFEIYYKGIELGNGFHELTDPKEQRQRFLDDLTLRQQKKYPTMPLDEHLLAALTCGLPPCAGVAIGIDRLVMLALNKNNIQEVLTFPVECA